MKKYKITAILLALTLVFTLAFVGCGKKDNDDSSSSSSIQDSSTGGGQSSVEKDVSIYLVDAISLQEYTSKDISFEIVGADASEIVWSSSNPEIAEVDANGSVSGISVGEATITATVGKVSATCLVSVTVNTSFPVLQLKQTDVMPRVGGSVIVEAWILFNGSIQDFDGFVWSSADNSIATVTGGEVVGVRVGETTVTVSAEFNGVLLEETITVKVVQGPA